MAQIAIVSGAWLVPISRGDDPPYPPMPGSAGQNHPLAEQWDNPWCYG